MITEEVIKKISPTANPSIVAGLVTYLNKYLPLYEINTLLRVKHFLGQTAEESAGYRTLTEYASGNEYEGRKDLGNVEAGDGERFKGRGMLQITGRANYKALGTALGVDLVDNPALAATPEISVRTACEYWKSHNLNSYADKDDIYTITRRINGGLNGLADRQLYTTRAEVSLKPQGNMIFTVVKGANMIPDVVTPKAVEQPEPAPSPVVVTPTQNSLPEAPQDTPPKSFNFFDWIYELFQKNN